MPFQQNFFSAGSDYATFDSHIPAPALRYAFNADASTTGQLQICVPGFYELFLNGKRLTHGHLAPFISNPDDILYVDVYNLSGEFRDGENVIGILLGNGAINSIGGGVWDFDKAKYRAAPCFALCFSGEFAGNALSFDASAFHWNDSPIVFNDLRAGEWYDARLETPHWNMPGFDDAGWKPVCTCASPRGTLRCGDYHPIEIIKELAPISIDKSHIGIYPTLDGDVTPPEDQGQDGYLFDFGENAAGICRLKLRSTVKGQKIVLQFGEIKGEKLPDGTTDRSETRGLDLRGFHYLPHEYNNRDVYICRGDAAEEWEPLFTYHGFRYCLVFGLREDQVQEDTLTYLVMNTRLSDRAQFSSSMDIVNRIWDATKRSDLANFYHFPTDCPHREKNGWTGDAMLSAEQMLLLFDAEKNFSEWLIHIRSAQLANGSFPGIIPTSGWGNGFGPVYDGIIIELPYRIWQYSGDTGIIRDNGNAIWRYLQFLDNARNSNGTISIGLGDWCQSARKRVDIPTAPEEITSTLVAEDSARKAAKMFQAIHATLQQQYAETLAAELHTAARKTFLRPSGTTLTARCQTAQAAALYFNLFEPGERQGAFQVLLDLIAENHDSYDCGIIGLRVLFHVLSRFGKTDLALRLITKPSFPSYGYWFQHGATSLWELNTPIVGIQSSCNHHFYGDVAAWFIKTLAGINLNPHGDNPDFVQIAPKFVDALSCVNASVQARTGEISVAWERTDDAISGIITIPDNMNAQFIADEHWQLEDGFTTRKLSGTCKLRLIPAGASNTYKFRA